MHQRAVEGPDCRDEIKAAVFFVNFWKLPDQTRGMRHAVDVVVCGNCQRHLFEVVFKHLANFMGDGHIGGDNKQAGPDGQCSHDPDQYASVNRRYPRRVHGATTL